MSFGKSGGTSVQTAELTPEQRAMIGAQTNFFTGTIAPSYTEAVRGAKDIYNVTAPGVTYAAQNLAGTAGQAQEVLGSTGESALRTGISGLQNVFDKDYETRQIQAALAPAQQQYETNIANQRAQFGGMGNLGSARQALAERQLASQTSAAQQQTAAQVLNQIAAQRAGVGTTLAELGAGGIGQAIGAAGQGVNAAMTPQNLYNQYASVIFGTPGGSYLPDFSGTQTRTTTGRQYNAGLNFGQIKLPGFGG